ncbi:hypothetical protein Rctr197k_030 [Virus Rctr197k]|nr:hypothetical protein Rctr197k_030 [Virus Rctr197k]
MTDEKTTGALVTDLGRMRKLLQDIGARVREVRDTTGTTTLIVLAVPEWTFDTQGAITSGKVRKVAAGKTRTS